MTGVRAVPLRARGSLDGVVSEVCGFPDGYDEDGVWIRARLGSRVGRGWARLDASASHAVEQCFSGAAVWSGGEVVAMMATRERSTGGRIAYAIPITSLRALFSLLELDPATASHWGPRSRGVSGDADAAGWLFCGRRRALSELVSWMTQPGGRGVRVVTGAPGTGKSALLGRLVTTADRRYRTRIPSLCDDDPAVAPAGAVDVIFHAKDRTVAEFVEHVGAVLGSGCRPTRRRRLTSE